MGIFELLIMNDELRDGVSGGASTDQLRQMARRLGMMTLRESGLKALFDGKTSIEEVVRETVMEEES
jgi:type IV pilus assembly protein PilB